MNIYSYNTMDTQFVKHNPKIDARQKGMPAPEDTGRLRNSITHAATAFSGWGTYTDREGDACSDATATGIPGKDEVYIGMNVEYAKYIEAGSSQNKNAVHFLCDAAANHGDEQKRIAEVHLREA